MDIIRMCETQKIIKTNIWFDHEFLMWLCSKRENFEAGKWGISFREFDEPIYVDRYPTIYINREKLKKSNDYYYVFEIFETYYESLKEAFQILVDMYLKQRNTREHAIVFKIDQQSYDKKYKNPFRGEIRDE